MTATVLIVADPNTVCAAFLGRLRSPVRYQGCYVPAPSEALPRIEQVSDDGGGEPPPSIPALVILPPDDGSRWWVGLREHEYAHARGWRHVQAATH